MKKLFLALALSGASMFAASVCDGGPGSSVNIVNNATLTASTNYADVSDTCVIGGYTFSNFDIYASAGDSSLANFTATVSVSGNTLELNYNQSLGLDDIVFYYDVTPGLAGITLEDGTSTSVTEVVCGTAFSDSTGNTTCLTGNLNSTTLFVNGSTPTATSAITAAAEDYIAKDIGGGSELFQIVAPEPMTLSLMGIGLLGLGFMGRKIRK